MLCYIHVAMVTQTHIDLYSEEVLQNIEIRGGGLGALCEELAERGNK